MKVSFAVALFNLTQFCCYYTFLFVNKKINKKLLFDKVVVISFLFTSFSHWPWGCWKVKPILLPSTKESQSDLSIQLERGFFGSMPFLRQIPSRSFALQKNQSWFFYVPNEICTWDLRILDPAPNRPSK